MASFSLVVPSYNQAPFLRDALDSVRRQRGVVVHAEVWDGGSTDGSLAVLESYGDSVRWRTGPDGGQVRAINAGLRALPGEICGYLNSDDVLLPDALSRVAEVFAENPDIDVVYGRAWFIDATGRRTREYPVLPYRLDDLIQHCFICQPAAFWRRRVHARYGFFNPSYDSTFDYEFWLRLAVGGARFHLMEDFLAESREHGATKSSRRRGEIFAEIRRMQLRHLGYCGRNWWEQQLRYWRDEEESWARHLLPGSPGQRLYALAWWPYVLCRYRLGGPWRYQPGDWRA